MNALDKNSRPSFNNQLSTERKSERVFMCVLQLVQFFVCSQESVSCLFTQNVPMLQAAAAALAADTVQCKQLGIF